MKLSVWFLTAAGLSAAASKSLNQPMIRPNLFFVENSGQYPADVRFAVRSGGVTVELLSGGDSRFRTARGSVLTQRFHGSRSPAGEGKVAQGRANFLTGNVSSHWVTGARQFSRVEYHNLHKGIELVYYQKDGRLEHDFLLAPHSDPALIRFRFDGHQGFRITNAGDLEVALEKDIIIYRKPVAFQGDRYVDVQYELLAAGQIGFQLGSYDADQPLVIDPVTVVTSVRPFQGNAYEQFEAIAADAQGNTYAAGWSKSTDFPLMTPYDNKMDGPQDCILVKLDPSRRVIWSTYLGGNSAEVATAIALDSSGNLLIAGATGSPDFPVINAVQPALKNSVDGFITRLSPNGDRILYSSFIGGTKFDLITDMVLDAQNQPTLVFASESMDMPASPNAFQSANRGAWDVYVARMSADLRTLTMGTYVGGGGEDYPEAVRLSKSGDVVIAGYTKSTNWPLTAEAFQRTYGGGERDALLAVLRRDGSGLMYSSYIGGMGLDHAYSVELDPNGYVWTGGYTNSSDFPVAPDAEQKTAEGNYAWIGQFGPGLTGTADTATEPSRDLLSVRGVYLSFVKPYPGQTVKFTWVLVLMPTPSGWKMIANMVTGDGGITYIFGEDGRSEAMHFNGPHNEFFAGVFDASRKVLFVAGRVFNENENLVAAAMGDVNLRDYFAPASLELFKDGPKGGLIEPGQAADFKLSLYNRGPEAAAQAVVRDTLPPGFTLEGNPPPNCSLAGDRVECALGTIPPKQWRIIRLTLRAPRNTGEYDNVAVASASNSLDSTARMKGKVSLPADVAVIKTGPPKFVTGQRISFTLTVRNNGPNVANNVRLIEKPDPSYRDLAWRDAAGNTCGDAQLATRCKTSMGVNEVWTVEVELTPTSAGGLVSNIAEVKADEFDPNAGNNWSLWKIESEGAVAADLQLFVNTEGNSIRLQALNHGQAAAEGTRLTFRRTDTMMIDPVSGCAILPGTVTCDLGRIPPNESRTVLLRFTPGNADLQFLAEVSSQTPDPAPQNNIRAGSVTLAAAAGQPVFAAAITNSASGTPGIASPGNDPAIYGSGLASALIESSGSTLARELGGTRVWLNGIPAPLYFVAPAQINFQVPWELAGEHEANLQVDNNGIASPPMRVQLSPFDPAVFTADQSGRGQGAIVIAGTTSLAAPEGRYPGSRPAKRGEYLSIYCNGLGPVANSPGSGQPASTTVLAPSQVQPMVTIGGMRGNVIFAGLAPGFIGLYQVNVEVPADAPVGAAVPLEIVIGGMKSNTVTVAISE